MSNTTQPTFYYVVEMAGTKRWSKCKGKALTMTEARKLLAQWRKNCPDDVFRINVVDLPE